MIPYAAVAARASSIMPAPRHSPCHRSSQPQTSAGTPLSGSALMRNAMSPSHSAAASRYSSEALIRVMKSSNHAWVGKAIGSSTGRRIAGGQPHPDRISVTPIALNAMCAAIGTTRFARPLVQQREDRPRQHHHERQHQLARTLGRRVVHEPEQDGRDERSRAGSADGRGPSGTGSRGSRAPRRSARAARPPGPRAPRRRRGARRAAAPGARRERRSAAPAPTRRASPTPSATTA